MDKRITLLFSLSLSGSVLIAILLLLKPLYQKRFSKKWQYYIWVIVIARLLFPWAVGPGSTQATPVLLTSQGEARASITSPESTISANGISLADDKSIANHAGSTDRTDAAGSTGSANTCAPTDRTDAAGSAGSANTCGPMEHTGSQNFIAFIKSALHIPEKVSSMVRPLWEYLLQYPLFLALWQNLFSIWLCVAAALFVWNIASYYSFVRYVKAGQEEITDFSMWESLGMLVETAGIKAPVLLFANRLISSPLLIGFLHPCIILPATDLSNTDFENTIRHEMIHYKRQDMLYKWVLTFTVCLHWFNPLVYLMRRKVNRMCELSCDEAVLGSLSPKSRKAYGDTLLHAANINQAFKNPPTSLALYEDSKLLSKNLLKERLDAIMEFKKKTFLCTALSLTMACTLTVSAAALGGQSFYTKNPAAQEINNDASIRIKDVTAISRVKDNTPAARIERKIKNGKIFIDNGQYFILCGKANKASIPTGSVSKGCIDITIVYKTGYACIDEVKLSDHLVKDVRIACQKEINGNGLTQSEAELVIALAKKIQAGDISPADTTDISVSEEYAKLGISKKDGKYYYNGRRLYCIIDLFANGSVKSYIQTDCGSVSLKIKRSKDGKIKKASLISNEKARHFAIG